MTLDILAAVRRMHAAGFMAGRRKSSSGSNGLCRDGRRAAAEQGSGVS
jgi:hypothetical protein